MRLNGAAMPPMDMARLVAGAGLSAAEEEALGALTERKKSLVESGTAEAPDPLLDALIAGEVAAVEEWLRENRRVMAAPAQWDAADELHRRFTVGSGCDR